MENEFSRTKNLIGEAALDILKHSHVAVFGVGGVGSTVVEALARSGVGTITLIDSDIVNVTNINRQLIALHSTIGKPKAEVAKERIKDINPNATVNTLCEFFNNDTADKLNFNEFSYIVDAIDTVTSKLLLIEIAKEKNIPIISSMGTGNKLNPEAFEVCDIYKTSVCPLARVMRRELKARGIKSLKTVYSKEIPRDAAATQQLPPGKRQVPASISFVPPVAGYIIAGEVIKDLITDEKTD